MLNFRTLTIYRLLEPDESGAGYKLELAQTGAKITGFLRQASPEYAAMVDGEYGRTYTFASDDFAADVKVGDELRDPADLCAAYSVKGTDFSQDGPGRRAMFTLVKAIQQ